MLIEDGAMASTNTISNYFYLGKAKNFSVHAEWTGTPNGTLKLQVSGKFPGGYLDGGVDPGLVAGDFIDLPDATVTIAGASGSQLWDVEDASYSWVKATYTNTSSTGTLQVTSSKK